MCGIGVNTRRMKEHLADTTGPRRCRVRRVTIKRKRGGVSSTVRQIAKQLYLKWIKGPVSKEGGSQANRVQQGLETSADHGYRCFQRIKQPHDHALLKEESRTEESQNQQQQ